MTSTVLSGENAIRRKSSVDMTVESWRGYNRAVAVDDAAGDELATFILRKRSSSFGSYMNQDSGRVCLGSFLPELFCSTSCWEILGESSVLFLGPNELPFDV